MLFERELLARVQSYLEGQSSFTELAYWVDDREFEWLNHDSKSPAWHLANAVLLTLYEHQHGDHTEQSLHDRVAEDFAEIVGSRAGR
jgi:hypothetical protein